MRRSTRPVRKTTLQGGGVLPCVTPGTGVLRSTIHCPIIRRGRIVSVSLHLNIFFFLPKRAFCHTLSKGGWFSSFFLVLGENQSPPSCRLTPAHARVPSRWLPSVGWLLGVMGMAQVRGSGGPVVPHVRAAVRRLGLRRDSVQSSREWR